MVELLRSGALRTDLIDDAAERLAEAFRRRGHRNVTVVPDRAEEGDRITIGFTITPGPQWRAASVDTAGDAIAGASRVLTTRAGAPIQDAQIDNDAQALERLLEGRGYLSANAGAEIAEQGGTVPVVFRIRAGVQTRVRSLTVESPVTLAEAPTAPFSIGEVFRPRVLARYRADLTTAYRNAGYAQVDMQTESTLSSDGREADLRLVVRPGPRLEIGEIVVAGLSHSREEVVRRELAVREGEPLRQDRLLESQRRLSGLGIFNRVTLSELDAESTERASLVVSVDEAPRTTVAYGLGAAGLGQGTTRSCAPAQR